MSSKHLIQVQLEILSRSVENMARILELLHVHMVDMASISYWSSVFSSVVKTILWGQLRLL